jgi:hypothetical protein
VADGALLCVLPDPVTCFAQASYSQRQEVRQWLRAQGIHSFRVVTVASHAPSKSLAIEVFTQHDLVLHVMDSHSIAHSSP